MNLNGTWRPVSIKLAGSEFDNSALQLMELTIEGDNYISESEGVKEVGKIKINSGTSPMSLDIVVTDGPHVGNVTQAIFQLTDQNRLTICYNLQKGNRPTQFASTADNRYFLVVYQKGK